MWGRRFTGATALFLLNRYLALLKYPVYIVGLQALSDKVSVFVSCGTPYRILTSRLLEVHVGFKFCT